MSAVVDKQIQMHPDNQQPVQNNDSDLQAQNLFNQIELEPIQRHQQQQIQQKQFQPSQQDILPVKKLRKLNKMQYDSDNNQKREKSQQKLDNNHQQKNQKKSKKSKKHKKDKKQRKLQKKQKKLKKHKKQLKLKKLRKQTNNQNEQKLQNEDKMSNQWSGQSSQSQDNDSDASSDSLLQRLNPSRKKNIKQKIKSAQKKQGFSLKELGNDAQIDYKLDKQQLDDDDSSYGRKKKNKNKVQKKQVKKNNELLKSLLDLGLCKQSEEPGENDGQENEVDNGLEQVFNMKGSKKKGPKIANKYFADIQIKQDQQNNKDQPIPKNIQLQIKPRAVNNTPSEFLSSFLNKTQKLKKVRGMQSEFKQQQYQKLQQIKAKQSMIKLINQKQLQQAQQVVLDVKIPQVIRGRQQINNSIFLKKVSSSAQSHPHLQNSSGKKQKLVDIRDKQKIKISRLDFFKSITKQVKTKKSRDISDQAIKNTFRVTDLQQIQEMRKKKQEQRRKQNLKQFSDEQDDEDYSIEKEEVEAKIIPQIQTNNLQFMNFKIEVQDSKQNENKQQNKVQSGQKQKSQEIENINKQISDKMMPEPYQALKRNLSQPAPQQVHFQIQLKKNKISDAQYRKLLQQEQGQNQGQPQQMQQMQAQEQQQQQEQSNKIDKDLNKMQLEFAADEQELNQNDRLLQLDDVQEQGKKIGQKVQIQVDVEISNSFDEEMQSQQQSQQQENVDHHADKNNQQENKYFEQMQEDGVTLKRNKYRNTNNTNKQIYNSHQNQQNINEKQNISHIQNSTYNARQNQQLRREFRKLRKLATILKIKRKQQYRHRRVGQFYDQEAEEGYDDEQNDNQARLINYQQQAKQYAGIDLDADLQEFLDNAVDINQENEELAFKKYMEDVKLKDKQQLKRIMNGDFKRRQNGDPMIEQQMEQEQKQRVERMQRFQQYIKKKQLQDDKQLYMNQRNEQKNSEQSQQDGSNSQQNENKDKKNNQKIEYELEEVDEMNQENLARYLDDKYIDNKRQTKIIRRPIKLPQSYQRDKKTQMRNTMKLKQMISQSNPLKMKKTSSHLNEMIMKNKQKVKPIGAKLIQGFGFFNRKKM